MRGRAQAQTGAAMLFVIFFMLIVASVIVVVSMNAKGSADRARAAQERIRGTGPVDEGLTMYQLALNTGRVDEHNGFALDETQLLELLNTGAGVEATGAEVLNNSDTSIPADYRRVDETTVPERARRTVRSRNEDGLYRSWQIYSIATPTWGTRRGGRVVVYIRGWVSRKDGTSSTKAELVRAELRPGRFSDYQILSDGRVLINDGALLNGRIHTNGYEDSVFGQFSNGTAAGFTAGQAMRIRAGALCSATTKLTAATGTVTAANPTCTGAISTRPGRKISLLRVDDGLREAWARCGTVPIGVAYTVQCFTGGSPTAGWDVTLSGTNVIVKGTGYPVTAYPVPAGGGVYLFDQRVNVSGAINGRRVTIGAFNRSSETALGGPGISIVGDVQMAPVGPESPAISTSSVGLVAQGDIELATMDDGAASCAVSVHAALASASGMLSFPQRYRSPVAIPGLPQCPGIASVIGSYSGHYPPYLRGPSAGFTVRAYGYDPSLYYNPPPLFPTTGQWEVLDYRDANSDCFRASDGALDVGKDGCA